MLGGLIGCGSLTSTSRQRSFLDHFVSVFYVVDCWHSAFSCCTCRNRLKLTHTKGMGIGRPLVCPCLVLLPCSGRTVGPPGERRAEDVMVAIARSVRRETQGTTQGTTRKPTFFAWGGRGEFLRKTERVSEVSSGKPWHRAVSERVRALCPVSALKHLPRTALKNFPKYRIWEVSLLEHPPDPPIAPTTSCDLRRQIISSRSMTW